MSKSYLRQNGEFEKLRQLARMANDDDRRENLPALDEYVKRIKIKNPITQEFNGTQGIYTQQNVEKQRSYNLPEWKVLTEETQHQPPAKRGERRRNQEKVVRGGGHLRGRISASTAPEEPEETPVSKRKPGRPARRPVPVNMDAESDEEAKQRRSGRARVPPSPDTPAAKPVKVEKAAKAKGRPPKNGGAGQTKSVSSRRLNNTSEAAEYIDEAAFKNFHYGMDDLDEYTAERCAELETHYWKSLGFNQPMYAADMPGSLFDDSTTSWNVAKLENLLDVLGTKVPGVNTAYLYMGMWKATFAWHLEDVDLYSINYIHFGAPKQWYSISQEDARKFEKAMKAVWPGDAKSCDQFLRHKTYLISPDVLLKQYGVKVNKLVHYEGEFVITFPYGYHSGYNIGYNCAESVNFATESWLEYGRIARKCNCEADNVWVDVSEIERKLRGEPTPEYYEETDDDPDLDGEDGNLPSPPASVKGKPATKKRKRGVKQEEPKKKKKIRIRIRAPTREPCAMCPNDNPWEALLPTDNGKKVHLSCAAYTPETYIVSTTGKSVVHGITTLDRARLDLKCNFCRSKRGACFQCSSKKCTRAFHATCALAAGVQVDSGLVPTFGEDGTEYFEQGYDFRCKYHRPKMPKNFNLDTLESSKLLVNYGKELKFNDGIQAQFVGGEVFGGLVVENRPSELSVVVDVLPEGYVHALFSRNDQLANQRSSDRVEVEYKWLCFLDPDDSQRPKISSYAIAMPEGMNKKAVSINNRQDGVPSQDQLFNDNPDYKWHDFYNNDMPPPGYLASKVQAPLKLKVDIDKPDQLYFYLGELSTDAKCFFTDKAGSKEVVAKANFIERMQPRPVYRYQGQHSLAAARPTPLVAPKRDTPRSVDSHAPKPLAYKPPQQAPAKTDTMWQIDHQSLANQRNFLTDSANSGRPSSSLGVQQPAHTPRYDRFGNELAGDGTAMRSFPTEQYYSMKMLPAAYPGQHSGFTKAARRESEDAQSIQRPALSYVPNYQSVKAQQAQAKQIPPGAPMVPMMGGSISSAGTPLNTATLPPTPDIVSTDRPSASARSYHSPYGAPLTPATTHLHGPPPKDASAPDEGYLANLRKYPYLLNSYLRKPKVYESPYPAEGGFSAAYGPRVQSRRASEQQRRPFHTPHGSISSILNNGEQGPQWTPPSQIWNHASLPPPLAQQQAIKRSVQPENDAAVAQTHRYPPPTYSTPKEFQRQIQTTHVMPSTASRDGAQARAMRDHGYTAYQPHYYPRNSFGQAYDSAKISGSPQAPTPSPLSDPNTATNSPGNMRPWSSRAEVAPMVSRATSGGGFGSMLPHAHGHGHGLGNGNAEQWRRN